MNPEKENLYQPETRESSPTANEPRRKPNVEKLTYNMSELCAALGLSQTTIWRLTQRRLLRPIPGIRHKLYAKTEVERFLGR